MKNENKQNKVEKLSDSKFNLIIQDQLIDLKGGRATYSCHDLEVTQD